MELKTSTFFPVSHYMEEKAAQIIRENIYAAVATSSTLGEPWNSPVYAVPDAQLNFYWASGLASQHSQNIAANPQVFLAIFDSAAPWGQGEGVFIQATAADVVDLDEITKACELRKARVPEAKHVSPDDFSGDDRPRRIYRAIPQKIRVSHDGKINGFFVDQRAAVDLMSLRRLLAR
jgi:nitroimidazol reductase NimA-like FMN-containing flavoprotein (pyridoxamine 5'-phosphate oxidase superfamily)